MDRTLSKENYKNLFGRNWKTVYVLDYFWGKGYSAGIVAKLNDNGERGYRSVIELRRSGGTLNPVVASVDLSRYDSIDPDKTIHALELLLLFQ